MSPQINFLLQMRWSKKEPMVREMILEKKKQEQGTGCKIYRKLASKGDNLTFFFFLEQQRPACTSAQSDQHLCYSVSGMC